MSTADLKLSLHQLIEGVSDSNVLEAVYTLLSKSSTSTGEDWYDTLSDEAKASIQRGLDDAKNGRMVSHDVAMSRLSQKIAHLKNA